VGATHSRWQKMPNSPRVVTKYIERKAWATGGRVEGDNRKS
jgi:hypothetical protein